MQRNRMSFLISNSDYVHNYVQNARKVPWLLCNVLLREQEADSSNLSTPTNKINALHHPLLFLYVQNYVQNTSPPSIHMT